MTRRKIELRTLLVLAGILAAGATVSLSVASAKSPKPAPVPPDAVGDHGTRNAVNAVRASSPSKFQTDGMVYSRTCRRPCTTP